METGSIGDRLSHVHHRGVRSAENIAAVSNRVFASRVAPTHEIHLTQKLKPRDPGH